jgi:hypothetical protein
MKEVAQAVAWLIYSMAKRKMGVAFCRRQFAVDSGGLACYASEISEAGRRYVGSTRELVSPHVEKQALLGQYPATVEGLLCRSAKVRYGSGSGMVDAQIDRDARPKSSIM